MEHLEYLGETAAWLLISLSILIPYLNFLVGVYGRTYDDAARLLTDATRAPKLEEGEQITISLSLTNTSLFRIAVTRSREICLLGIDGRRTSVVLPPEAEITSNPSGAIAIRWEKH